MLVRLTITNKGPSVATDVRFGLELLDDWRTAATQHGRGVPTQVITALAPGDTVEWHVRVPQDQVGRARGRGFRVEHAITNLWAEYRDSRGDLIERAYGFNTQA